MVFRELVHAETVHFLRHAGEAPTTHGRVRESPVAEAGGATVARRWRDWTLSVKFLRYLTVRPTSQDGVELPESVT